MSGRRWRLAAALLALLCTAASASVNDSSADANAQTGQTWETAAVAAQTAQTNEAAEAELLKWALSHSDPDALRAAAAEARREADAGSPEFRERQQRVQQLLEAMRAEPSEAELMQEAVAILSNASAPQQQLGNALEALRYLVEPVDNANNLQGMGGLAPVVALLAPRRPAGLQAAAAHLLGTAASNNHEFQRQLLADHPETLLLLLQLLGSGSGSGIGIGIGSNSAASSSDDSAAQAASAAATAEAATKALYCLAAMLRLNADFRVAFYQAAGVQTLQLLLGSRQVELRLKRKALSLLADLIQLDTAAMGAAAAAAAQQLGPAAGPAGGLDYPAAVATALQLLNVEQQAAEEQEQDRDLQEKALLVLQALLAPPDGGHTTLGTASPGSGSGSSRQAAAELVAESGGRAILRRLQASLQAAAAAAAAADGPQEEEGDASYLAELLQLARRVEEQAAAGSAGGGSAVTGGSHDSTEL